MSTLILDVNKGCLRWNPGSGPRICRLSVDPGQPGMGVLRGSAAFLPFPEGVGLSGSGVNPVGAAVEGGLW